jgi:hypothetical protein
MRSDEIYHLLDDDPVARELLGSGIPARLAYLGLDGAPRVIPIGFHYTGTSIDVFTVPRAPKVAALRANAKVALTIDTESQPPNVLMIRGEAEVEVVPGVPDDYLKASRKIIPADQFDAWEQQVRGLYDEMARISITPSWVRVLDFETRVPRAVEQLAREKGLAR